MVLEVLGGRQEVELEEEEDLVLLEEPGAPLVEMEDQEDLVVVEVLVDLVQVEDQEDLVVVVAKEGVVLQLAAVEDQEDLVVVEVLVGQAQSLGAEVTEVLEHLLSNGQHHYPIR